MKVNRKLLLSALVITILSSPYCMQRIDAAEKDTTKIDAVLAMDVSNSMNESDVNKVGNEAMKMFIDMSSVEGDKIGVVAYTDQIVRERAPLKLDGAKAKGDLKGFIDQLSRGPYTDVAVGVDESVKILESTGTEPGHIPMIVLFTDGNNSLSPNNTQEKSDLLLQDALKRAKAKGIPIYTIGLNADGKLNRDPLQKISDETNGKAFVTSSASDLPKILSDIYADHLKLKVVPLTGLTANGEFQEVTVNIPNSSVIEGNISLIAGSGVEVKLFDPTGKEQQLPSNNAQYSASTSYSLIKMIKPMEGNWKLQVKGVDKDHIDINLIYNYDISLMVNPLPNAMLKVGDLVPIKAELVANGQPVTDANLYKNLKAKLLIKDVDSQKSVEKPLTVGQQSVEGSFQLPESHDYELTVRVEDDNFIRESPVLKVSAKTVTASTPAPAVPVQQTTALVQPEKSTPWLLYGAIAAGLLLLAALLSLLLTFRKKATRGFVGQLVLELKDEEFGERSTPQYKRLSMFRGKFQLHQLVQLAPEFSETKDIWFKPGKGDRLVLWNKTDCVVEKSGRVIDASKGLELNANDRIRVLMKQTNKSIMLEYLR